MIKFKASFDDGCQYDLRVADLLERYGFDKHNVTFYIPSRWHDVNRMHGDLPLTQFELLNIARRFNIGSHTIDHPMLTRITVTQAEKQIVESKRQLQEMLGIEINSFCYPRGYANDIIRAMVRQHYKTARNTAVGNFLLSEDPIWESPTVHVAGKRRKEYEGTDWLTEGRRLLGEVLQAQRDNPKADFVFHIWGHSWEIERYGQWSSFALFLDEIWEAQKL